MSVAEIVDTTQYLTFRLDEELFAFDISKVKEVLDFTTITRIPRLPKFVRGVINLRGSVVPVVDLRVKFGMKSAETTMNTCIIIVEVVSDTETIVLGALADSVQEVIALDPSHIEPPPKLGTRMKTEFIRGMGKKDEKFVIIFDVDRIFSDEELSVVQEAGEEQAA